MFLLYAKKVLKQASSKITPSLTEKITVCWDQLTFLLINQHYVHKIYVDGLIFFSLLHLYTEFVFSVQNFLEQVATFNFCAWKEGGGPSIDHSICKHCLFSVKLFRAGGNLGITQ